MKFYFCEACGKRLTEDQIASGEGKDKKLKGVFCTQCAVGVTTMDSLPLTQDSAKKLVAREEKATARSSRNQLKPAKRRRPSGRTSTSDRRPHVADTGKGKLVFGIAFLGTICLIGLLALVLSGDGGKEQQVTAKPAGKSSSAGNPTSKRKTPDPPKRQRPEKPLTKPETTGRQQPPRPSPKPAAEKKAGPAPNAEATREPTPSKPETPTPDAPDDKNSMKAQQKPATPESKAAKGRPEKNEDAEALAKVKERERQSFSEKLADVLDLISNRALSDAADAARKAAGDKALGHLQPAAQALPAAIAVLMKLDESNQQALRDKIGSKVELTTRKGIFKGELKSVIDGALEVQPFYVINRQRKYGKVATVRLSDMMPESEARLYPPFKPAKPEEHIGAALTALARHRVTDAERALAAIGESAIGPPLRERLEALREKARETAASDAWEALAKACTGNPTRQQAAMLGKRLSAYLKTHGTTAFVRANTKAIAETRSRLFERMGATVEILQKVFLGEVKAYAPANREITVFYDFERTRQMPDFGTRIDPGKSDGLRSEGGGLRFHLRMAPLMAWTRRFDTTRDFDIGYTLRLKWSQHSWKLGIVLGEKNPILLRLTRNGMTIMPFADVTGSNYAATRRLAHKEFFIYHQGLKVRIIRRGNRISFSVKGSTLKENTVEADLPEGHSGNRIGWGGMPNTDYTIDNLTIRATLDQKWLNDAMKRLPP